MISIIVPAYNEKNRLMEFTKSLIEYSRKNFEDYEIIFVDDGSKYNTLDIMKNLKTASKSSKNIRIISYKQNQGKGHAVKIGVLEAKGDKILFIDADGSIAPEEIPKMIEKLDKYDVVIGDRYSKESNIEQPHHRVLTGTVFSVIANIIFPINTVDTLCGFKGFRREAARKIFSRLISNRWVFDVEVIYRAQKMKYKIYKMPFTWKHKEGSKIKIYAPFFMVLDLLKLKFKILYA